MKPEAAYKMIKVWSLTNATIMVILLLIQCRSLLNVLGTITIVPTFFIGIIGGYETYSYDYTNLLKNVTEKREKRKCPMSIGTKHLKMHAKTIYGD